MSNDIILQEGQKLIEFWEVQFVGKNRIHRPVEDWVECRIVKMYHSTVYGGSTGSGSTVDEARLEAVLATARAICDDESAFQHDADEIFKAEMLRWFEGKLQEHQDERDWLDEDEEDKKRGKIKRRIKLLEQVMAEWQEDHDYWPEKEEASRAAARAEVIREQTARRRAASARLSARAAESKTTADAS